MKLLSFFVSLILISFLCSCLISCNSGQTAKAQIFERKHIDENKLLVKYRFNANDKQFIDSAAIENTVLNSDTITVAFDQQTPEKSTPQLK